MERGKPGVGRTGRLTPAYRDNPINVGYRNNLMAY
jgi:hypothetical protein